MPNTNKFTKLALILSILSLANHSLASDNLTIDVHHGIFEEDTTLRIKLVYRGDSTPDEFDTEIRKNTSGTNSVAFKKSQDIDYVSATLYFNESKHRTALYREYEIQDNLIMTSLEIIPTAQDIIFNGS